MMYAKWDDNPCIFHKLFDFLIFLMGMVIMTKAILCYFTEYLVNWQPYFIVAFITTGTFTRDSITKIG